MALQACRLELELRDEKVASLGRELEELAFGGAAEEEVAALRKAKHALERRAKEQEEELDELAGQVGLLEAAKVRLEMSLEQQRKEARRETAQRDDELEEIRGNAHKKVRGKKFFILLFFAWSLLLLFAEAIGDSDISLCADFYCFCRPHMSEW